VSQLCLGVVAQPLRRAENASVLSLVLVWPLCGSGGERGKQSTPRVWQGGTGEHSAVGKRERQGERTRHSTSAGQRFRVIRHQIQVRNTLFNKKKM
jgi:hypothetical protein